MRKISPPPRFDPRTVQPVASRYTDYDNRLTPAAKGEDNSADQTANKYTTQLHAAVLNTKKLTSQENRMNTDDVIHSKRSNARLGELHGPFYTSHAVRLGAP